MSFFNYVFHDCHLYCHYHDYDYHYDDIDNRDTTNDEYNLEIKELENLCKLLFRPTWSKERNN